MGKVNIGTLKAINKKFNIFTSIRENIDHAKNKTGPLSGTFCAIKDNIATIEEPTTCASKILSTYTSPFNATVVDLLENSGSTVVGKTNLDEFGMGNSTTNSYFGSTLNPIYENDKEMRIVGGSSGGSAAAVASGVSDFALGTDTGGSVRLPAAYTGIVGFKPSYGRISRWGVIAYAQSLDTVGILAKDVTTTRKVYDVLNQYDDKDPTSLSNELRSQFAKIKETEVKVDKKIRIGVPMECNLQDLSEKVKKSWLDLLKTINNSDKYEIMPVSIPSIKSSLPAYYILAPSEASSNLSRYDGIRYGFRETMSESDIQSDEVIDQEFTQTRAIGFGEEVIRRIILGSFSLSSHGYSSHFLKAQRVRAKLIEEFNQVFKLPHVLLSDFSDTDNKQAQSSNPTDEKVDFLVFPTSIDLPPTLSAFLSDQEQTPIDSYVNDVLTVPSSLAGLPTCSIPWKSSSDKPLGFQIMGQFGDDLSVLQVSQDLMDLNSK
ncbi:ligase activity protein [[Candida] boidinii]|nr:ligase activity protein [[Candida] boidinii]